MQKSSKSKLFSNPDFILFLTIVKLIGIWGVLLLTNYFLLKNGFFTGSRITFPMSVVYFSKFSLTGSFFAILFLSIGLFTLNHIRKLSISKIITLSILLIILGNLSQGSIHNTFLRPFLDTDFQYYTDAIKITNGVDFFRNFNTKQLELTMHAKTHPAYITWFHYIILKLFNQSTFILSIVFSCLSLMGIFVFNQILYVLKTPFEQQKLLIFLYAIIPSINIYTIVSIDGIFLTFSLIFLWGLIRIIHSDKTNLVNIILLGVGFCGSNLISFSGTFLCAILGITSLIYLIKGKKHLFISSLIIVLVFVSINILSYYSLGYDHLEAFFTASKSENPHGFMGFHQPLVYLFTRLEDICEILLFLSFGFTAYLFKKDFWKNVHLSHQKYKTLSIIAFSSILLMFITGAYGTGETARACLYLYPYFMILLINIKDHKIILNIIYLSLIQTFFMQLLGDYFW